MEVIKLDGRRYCWFDMNLNLEKSVDGDGISIVFQGAMNAWNPVM